MKILLVVSSLGGGGAERIISQLANYWANKEWEVSVVTLDSRYVPDFYSLHSGVRRVNINVHIDAGVGLFRSIRLNIVRASEFRNVVRNIDPDVVISFITVTNVMTIFALLGMKVRVIVSERSEPRHDYSVSTGWQILRLCSYWRADFVVAQTKPIANWLRKWTRANAVVIPNSLRQLPPIEIEAPRDNLILSIGRLEHVKGFDLLLSAFSDIHSKGIGWTLAIVGEGSELSSLVDLSRQLGISDSVQFIGRDSNVESWLRRASIVVQPSRYEGFPNAVLEAMGMGVPVIASSNGAAALITNDQNGILVPVGDKARIACAIVDLIHDPCKRARLAKNAAKVRSSYSISKVMAKWEAILYV